MDDGEVELSDLLTGDSSNTFHAPPKFEDPLLDDLLKKSRTCTHTHTCNPPDHDSTHAHTCYHTHAQALSSKIDDHAAVKPERPSGNRVAVRKYREKKKAQNAYLEEEVKKPRVMNHGLIRKLQRQAALEAEAVRLRSLLLDLKVDIDKEVSASPFYKQNCNGSFNGCCDRD